MVASTIKLDFSTFFAVYNSPGEIQMKLPEASIFPEQADVTGRGNSVLTFLYQ